MADFTGFNALKIGREISMLICSCPKFESTRTKLKRQSFMQKKLHVKIWTFGNKLEDVSVDVPTWERWEHGVKNVPDFQYLLKACKHASISSVWSITWESEGFIIFCNFQRHSKELEGSCCYGNLTERPSPWK